MLDQIKLFERFGLFFIRDFLDPQLCAEIQAEMKACQQTVPGAIYLEDGQLGVREQTRKTTQMMISSAMHQNIKTRLMEVKPQLEKHFQADLVGCLGPHFLRYNVGEFYLRHLDTHPNGENHQAFRNHSRRVSTVIFINSETSELQADHYCGGALMFYPRLSQNQAQEIGLSLNGQSGLLVAFDSPLPHEVQPVTAGQRLTIVSWFLELNKTRL